MARGLDFSARVARVQRVLAFGDVAWKVAIGSSRYGWSCPCCGGRSSVRERLDHKGARCRSCGEGFDVLKFALRFLGKSDGETLTWLEALADAKEEKAAKARSTPDLFGGGA